MAFQSEIGNRKSKIRRSTMATRKQRTFGNRAVEDGLSLLAGAGIGMALMYLLDPEQGRERRYRMRRAAGDALESAGATISSSLGAAAGGASSFGSRVRDRVSGAYDSASDYANDGASN